MALILGRAHADVRRGYKLRTQMKPSAKKADNDRGGRGVGVSRLMHGTRVRHED
jgi:hypothetical protein